MMNGEGAAGGMLLVDRKVASKGWRDCFVKRLEDSKAGENHGNKVVSSWRDDEFFNLENL